LDARGLLIAAALCLDRAQRALSRRLAGEKRGERARAVSLLCRQREGTVRFFARISFLKGNTMGNATFEKDFHEFSGKDLTPMHLFSERLQKTFFQATLLFIARRCQLCILFEFVRASRK